MAQRKKPSISGTDYPALLLDEKLYIIEKNRAAGEAHSPFRRGANFRNYLALHDLQRVKDLPEGASTALCLRTFDRISVVVRHTGKYYVVKVTVLTVLLTERLCELMNSEQSKMLALLPLTVVENGKDLAPLRIRHIINVQRDIQDYLRIVGGTKHEMLQEGSLSCVAEDTFTAAKRILEEHSFHLHFTLPEAPVFTVFNERDLVLILATALSLTVMLSCTDNVEIKLYSSVRECFFSFTTECLLPAETTDIFRKGDYERHSFAGKNGEVLFLLSYLERLCGFYDQTFGVSLFNGNHLLQLGIGIPLRSRGGEVRVCEPGGGRTEGLETLLSPALEMLVTGRDG